MGILTRGYLGFSGSLHLVEFRWCRHSIGPPDSGRSCISAFGRTAPVGFGALPDSLTNVGRSHLRLFGQLQGIINLDAEVAHGAFELGVPKQ